MSRLNFAPLGDAFILGSQQIKDTQEEIARLKALVLQTSGLTSSSPVPEPPIPPVPPPEDTYKRIGPPDPIVANFSQSGNMNQLLDQLIQTPRFQDIVKQYIADNYSNYKLNSVTSKENFGLTPDTRNLLIFGLIIVIIYLLFNLF